MLLFKDCTLSPHPSFVHILLTHACWKDLHSALRLCFSTSSAVTSPYSLPHSQERGAFYSVIPQESHFPCKDSHCVISSWPVLCPKLWSPWGQCLPLFISPGNCMTSGTHTHKRAKNFNRILLNEVPSYSTKSLKWLIYKIQKDVMLVVDGAGNEKYRDKQLRRKKANIRLYAITS